MNYSIGKTLLWVPYHADEYSKHRLVMVVEMRGADRAKLDNGWVVNASGDSCTTEPERDGKVINVIFEPAGYVDDCL